MNKMKRISARYLLQFDREEIWNHIVGEFRLLFDNGEEIVTNYREVGYSSYFWDFHRQYPLLPLLPSHHVAYVLNGRRLSSGTHIHLLSLIYWDAVAAYGFRTPLERDPLVKLIYEVTNNLYNGMIVITEPFVVSIDILDFLEVTEHPAIQNELENLEPNRDSIDKCYKTIAYALHHDDALKDNALARAVRSKMVNEGQVLQCVGPRGYPTEVDGEIFKVPVLRSYFEGMQTLYDSIAESRTAAKSLYFAEVPLQDAEYFARRLQLLCMVVETVYHTELEALDEATGQIVKKYDGDCGSQQYITTTIRPKSENFPGDFNFMIGKFYMDDDGLLKPIRKTDTHLIGRKLKLRSSLTCRVVNPHAICRTCFGELSDNLNHEVNLGHICSATITQKTSQSVLSNKHLDSNSRAEPVKLSREMLNYFRTGPVENAYYLNPALKGQSPKLLISEAEASGLTDINVVDSIDDMVVTRVSSIDLVGFSLTTKNTDDPHPIVISQHGRHGYMTTEFLKFVKERKWQHDARFNFVFDLEGWDYNQPIFKLPEMEYSYSKHSNEVAKIIESRMENLLDRLKTDSPVSILFELHELVNSKLNVNIAMLEVIIYASMIADGYNDQFGLARNCTTGSLGVAAMTIANRSLSAMYAYKDQKDVITTPRNYYPLDRPDSVFDAFICPKEVVEHYQ